MKEYEENRNELIENFFKNVGPFLFFFRKKHMLALGPDKFRKIFTSDTFT